MPRMMKFGCPVGGIIQQSFIVPDLKAAMDQFLACFKTGPFFVVEHFPLKDYRYRGKPVPFDVSAAIAFSGGMFYELIQQNNDAPSAYLDSYNKQGWGFHHWAVASDDFDKDIKFYQDQGAPMALYGLTDFGTRVAYMDTTDKLLGMVEIMEAGETMENFFTMIASASVNWDGADPVRTLS